MLNIYIQMLAWATATHGIVMMYAKAQTGKNSMGSIGLACGYLSCWILLAIAWAMAKWL